MRRNRDFALADLSGQPDSEPVLVLRTAVYAAMTAENAPDWYERSGYDVK